MNTLVALNSTDHINLKVKHNNRYDHVKGQHVLPLTVHEFVSATQDYPIVFIKNNETGQFNSFALAGLKPNENLFWHQSQWRANYIPEELQCYPFILRMHNNDPDQGLLCFDPSSELFGDAEGQALFAANGLPTETLDAIKKRLATFAHKKISNQNFIKLLLTYDLLMASTLSLRDEHDKSYELTGLYTISEKKLNDLSDEQFCVLRKNGLLVPIYAALMSLQNVDKMLRMKASFSISP